MQITTTYALIAPCGETIFPGDTIAFGDADTFATVGEPCGLRKGDNVATVTLRDGSTSAVNGDWVTAIYERGAAYHAFQTAAIEARRISHEHRNAEWTGVRK